VTHVADIGIGGRLRWINGGGREIRCETKMEAQGDREGEEGREKL